MNQTGWATLPGTPSDSTPGWQQVQAICDYVHEQTTFDYKFGRQTKTAYDVHVEKSGVCRDYAHLAITLCRAMNILARYVSGYISDIDASESGPTDFCAWFEVFLDGAWHAFDARHSTPRIGRIEMVRGRDAADVAMITSFELTRSRIFGSGPSAFRMDRARPRGWLRWKRARIRRRWSSRPLHGSTTRDLPPHHTPTALR